MRSHFSPMSVEDDQTGKLSAMEPYPTFTAVSNQPLVVDRILRQITTPESGAVCSFTGVVRSVTRGADAHRTEYLEYEAYTEMAQKKLRQIAREIREQWPAVIGVAVVQRIGHLLPGTPSIVVACSAGHRDSGVFDAARYGIDRVKQIVPIWKKEVGPGGEEWVEGDYHPDPGE